MKAVKCYVIVWGRSGAKCGEKHCESLKEAKAYAKGCFGFSYKVYDSRSGNCIAAGYCK